MDASCPAVAQVCYTLHHGIAYARQNYPTARKHRPCLKRPRDLNPNPRARIAAQTCLVAGRLPSPAFHQPLDCFSPEAYSEDEEFETEESDEADPSEEDTCFHTKPHGHEIWSVPHVQCTFNMLLTLWRKVYTFSVSALVYLQMYQYHRCWHHCMHCTCSICVDNL